MAVRPKISVVIPVLNGEQTIARALGSVFAQSFSDLEVIVVDDHSTDRTVDIVHQYSGAQTSIIRSTSNAGAGAARNKGIAAARGDWIAFLDADDAWRPEKLERQIKLLTQSPRPVAACATGYHLEKNGRSQIITLNLSSRQFREDILLGCTISPGSTLVVERAIFDKIGGFDEKFRRLEDWDWLMRFSQHYDMVFVPEPMADIYLTPKDPPLHFPTFDPVQHGISRMREKHARQLGSLRERLLFRSSLMIERAAVLHRNGRQIPAALLVIGALAIFPIRNVAFFKTIWRATTSRVGTEL